MPFRRFSLALLLGLSLASGHAARAQDPSGNMTTVGGGEMLASTDLMSNLGKSLDHTIFVQALNATGLNDALAGSGPFTVFAPTDVAFQSLQGDDKDKYANLMSPDNRELLTQLLNYHIVPGRYTSADIEKMAASGNGKATLRTVEGDTLTIEKKGGQWMLEDSSHHSAAIQQSDVQQSNGILYVIDTVMRPAA